MARSRNIKPGLFKNEILGVADPIYTIIFEGLWLLADREGRLEDRPLRIKAEIIPYRDGINMNEHLHWLSANGFIIRYNVDGVNYIQVVNFKKHQNPHKNEAESLIPQYIPDTCESSEKIGTCPDNNGSTPADSLNLIPDSLIPLHVPPQDISKKENTDKFRPDFISPALWKELIASRKKKKLQNSELALKTFCNSILPAIEAGFTIEDCIGQYVASKWDRFNVEWMKSSNNHLLAVRECSVCNYRLIGACRQDKPDCKSFVRAV